MRVLVVDDHALFREGLRMLLGALDASMDVTLTATAEQGVQLAADNRFDLILMDWHMDGLSGAQALASLHEASPHARLVVLSGEKNPSLIRSVVDQGAAGFIPKDIAPDVLLQALRTIAAGGIYLPVAVLAGVNAPAEPPSRPAPCVKSPRRFRG